MILTRWWLSISKAGAPRIRGDDPILSHITMNNGLVLPASAGMILERVGRHGKTQRAPRICGDDPFAYLFHPERHMCSPHPRG